MPKTPPGVVLIVDDCEDDRETLSRLLTPAGYRTLGVQTGPECLELLEKWQKQQIVPAAIVLDLLLPKMNGLEVLQALRQSPHLENVPILLVSSYPHDPNCGECLARGARSVLTKPLQSEALLTALGGPGIPRK